MKEEKRFGEAKSIGRISILITVLADSQ